jgi:hypothetical protein
MLLLTLMSAVVHCSSNLPLATSLHLHTTACCYYNNNSTVAAAEAATARRLKRVSTESRFRSEMGDSGQQQRPVRRYFSKEAKNRLIREGALRGAEGEARFDIDKVSVLHILYMLLPLLLAVLLHLMLMLLTASALLLYWHCFANGSGAASATSSGAAAELIQVHCATGIAVLVLACRWSLEARSAVATMTSSTASYCCQHCYWNYCTVAAATAAASTVSQRSVLSKLCVHSCKHPHTDSTVIYTIQCADCHLLHCTAVCCPAMTHCAP